MRGLGVIGMIGALGRLTFIYHSPPARGGLPRSGGLAGAPARFFVYLAPFALAAFAAKTFCVIVFGVDEEKFRAVEARS